MANFLPCIRVISPYIREGSGLKLKLSTGEAVRGDISPYIREGSGLKPSGRQDRCASRTDLPLHP